MKNVWKHPAVQALLCLGVFALVGYYAGVAGMVMTSPLFAAWFLKPLLAFGVGGWRRIRRAVWMPVHGQHYVYQGVTLHLLADSQGAQWIALRDVQTVVGATAPERSLQLTYPGKLVPMGKPAHMHMQVDALVTYLAKQNNPVCLRFKVWVDRNIVFPARKRAGNTPAGEADQGA